MRILSQQEFQEFSAPLRLPHNQRHFMQRTTPLYRQLLGYLRQYSQAADVGHLTALAWMVYGLLCSASLNLSKWESYVVSAATQAQSYERRWQRFMQNPRISLERIYLPLVMLALHN
jgi:hypothetical protein